MNPLLRPQPMTRAEVRSLVERVRAAAGERQYRLNLTPRNWQRPRGPDGRWLAHGGES